METCKITKKIIGWKINSANKKSDATRPDYIVHVMAPKRPKELICDIHHATVKGIKYTVLVSMLGDDPYEIFMGHTELLSLPSKCNKGKVVKVSRGKYNLHIDLADDELVIKDIVSTFDNKESAWATRMISTALRHGTPVDFLVEQLQKDGGVADINKVLGRILKKYIKDGVKVRSATSCPNCEGTDLIYQEGCVSCLSCGHSKCG